MNYKDERKKRVKDFVSQFKHRHVAVIKAAEKEKVSERTIYRDLSD